MNDKYRTNKKQTLGFDTKSEAISHLKAQGKTYGEIGALLGMEPKQASALLTNYRQRAKRLKQNVEINRHIWLDIEREAVKRGMTTSELTNKLLFAIVADKLFGAVLDG